MKTSKEIPITLNCPAGYYFIEGDTVIRKGDLWASSHFRQWRPLEDNADKCINLTVNQVYTAVAKHFHFCRKIIATVQSLDMIANMLRGRKCLYRDEFFAINDVYTDNGRIVADLAKDGEIAYKKIYVHILKLES